MKEPRYTITLTDVSVDDALALLWAAQGLRHPAQKGSLRKLQKATDAITEQHHQWRQANRRCARKATAHPPGETRG